MNEIASHPLIARFWKKPGVQWAENASMTLADTKYTIELDDAPSLRLCEEEHCQYTDAAEVKRTFEGSWEPVRMTPQEVVLRLIGVDQASRSVEMFLLLTAGDVSYLPMDGWLARHLGPGAPE
jgi:hypothetical protein